MAIKNLKYFAGGKFLDSSRGRYADVYDPSVGEVAARVPLCSKEEIEYAIARAKEAFESWSNVPVMKRVQIIYKFRELLEARIDELTEICAREHGKVWNEARGDILKVKEPVELACSAPSLLKGESLRDASLGYDAASYREPAGVFAGIVPFNFPGMIPMGWITPICIACGNTIVVKAASQTPTTCLRLAELWQEAGLPDGVVNVLACSRNEAEIFLSHPDIKGISFVGSTKVGLHIYSTAASYGKRVQALCQAKNHGLVLEDAALERTAEIITRSAFGCAGERCMALSVAVVQNGVADELVDHIVKYAKALKIGPAYDRESQLGPVATPARRQSVLNWIDKGIEEGAKLVLDGRNVSVLGYENGFYIGPTIFDRVTENMTVGTDEIFGPVLCIKRVENFEEGLRVMNANPFANGSVIFTRSGYYAREFAKRTHGGMVGVNVGVPVPVGIFPFGGRKLSFFGNLRCLGEDGFRFYTETKTVTTRWLDGEETKPERV